MKNLIFLFTFFAFFASCNNTSTEEKKETPKEKISDLELWSNFRQKFQKAVEQNNVGKIVDLAALPLKGNFFTDEKEDGLSKAGLIKNYEKIFEPLVVQRIMNAKPKEWGEITTQTENDEKYIGVPIGTNVKLLRLLYVEDEGKENQTESVQMFYFKKVDGEYKWCSMLIIG